MRDVEYWERMRATTAMKLMSSIPKVTEFVIRKPDERVREMAKSVRADLCGITHAGMRMPSVPDVPDAGPESKLKLIAGDSEPISVIRPAIVLAVYNTLYKTGKWQSVWQMDNLQSAVQSLGEFERSECLSVLMMLQMTSGSFQACLESDAETKPHLNHDLKRRAVWEQLSAFETMGLPFVIPSDNGEWTIE